MKCKCGNEIDIKMGARVDCRGCRILTSMTTIMTVECSKCKEKFQVPVSSKESIVKEEQ
ncbi:hypothetical protein GF386_05680 [Candidatus Pacearchaeota archaeon]|nr:hypothetical protein [Candidatus Pacearchaeota archaeon]MBD3283584.1 hypothetical protein [Candidatus Pacearchaeota archaeon]